MGIFVKVGASPVASLFLARQLEEFVFTLWLGSLFIIALLGTALANTCWVMASVMRDRVKRGQAKKRRPAFRPASPTRQPRGLPQ
jgi:hypothetical protein